MDGRLSALFRDANVFNANLALSSVSGISRTVLITYILFRGSRTVRKYQQYNALKKFETPHHDQLPLLR